MKTLGWVAITLAGFALMCVAYYTGQRGDPAAMWADGAMYLGTSIPDPAPAPLVSVPADVRLLPIGPAVTQIVAALTQHDPAQTRNIIAQVSEKLVLLDPHEAGIDTADLDSGRLPTPGRAEILAGHGTTERDRLVVGTHMLTIVGVLHRDAALLDNSYLLPPDPTITDLCAPALPDCWHARLVHISASQGRDKALAAQLAATYPPPPPAPASATTAAAGLTGAPPALTTLITAQTSSNQGFACARASSRSAPGPFALYLLGLALQLLGGSALLIAAYGLMAQHVTWRVFKDPLGQLHRRRRLLWAVHLLYFGLFFCTAIVAYRVPVLQSVLTGSVRTAFAGHGVLSTASKAYASKNVAYAAAVTWLVNFFVGSLACITFPSLIVPGCGALLALFRAGLWGLVLSPTQAALAGPMLPHSWTVLLEGEGYILAAFFALLLPLALFESDAATTLASRFKRALLLNLQSCASVTLVLAVAACYEATEVIVMMR